MNKEYIVCHLTGNTQSMSVSVSMQLIMCVSEMKNYWLWFVVMRIVCL